MIIDFHTHAFPDALAPKTIPALAAHCRVRPSTNGTADALCAKLTKSGVDLGVVMPVVTRPGQFETVNRFAAELSRRPGLLSFGGIHPDDEAPEEHLAQIRALGLPGVKIHPDYQGVYIDDPRYIRIAREALRLGLMILTHAGEDDAYPDDVHCPPHRAARFLDAVYDGGAPTEAKIIFAHGGGNRQFDEVVRCLAGRNVYFDLSYILSYAAPDEIMALIRAHGANRILFATDCPWGEPAAFLAYVRALPLTAEERNAILGGNAEALLRDFL